MNFNILSVFFQKEKDQASKTRGDKETPGPGMGYLGNYKERY